MANWPYVTWVWEVNPKLKAAVSNASPPKKRVFMFEVSVFVCGKYHSFSSLERPVTVLHMSTLLVRRLVRGKKSSWWYKGLGVSWNIEVTLMCKIKMKLYVCVCVVCVTFLPRAALAVWGLDTACGCQLLFFFLKLFHPVTPALTRCLSGWNSSGLNT